MKEKITKLIDVKSIVTIALTILFVVLAIMKIIDGNAVITIYTTVIAFYFGTQHEKNKNIDDHKDDIIEIDENVEK